MENKMTLNKDGIFNHQKKTENEKMHAYNSTNKDMNTLIFDSLCEIKELLCNIKDIQLPKITAELARISIEADEHTMKLANLTGTINRINDVVHKKDKNGSK